MFKKVSAFVDNCFLSHSILTFFIPAEPTKINQIIHTHLSALFNRSNMQVTNKNMSLIHVARTLQKRHEVLVKSSKK